MFPSMKRQSLITLHVHSVNTDDAQTLFPVQGMGDLDEIDSAVSQEQVSHQQR